MTTSQPELTSTANPRIKAAVGLRDRREREATGLTILDGVREIGRALSGGVEIVELFACDALLTSPAGRDVLGRVRAAGGPVTSVAPVVLERLAFGARNDGLVAVIRMPRRALAALVLPAAPAAALVAVVENVEKPGNLGAIMRSADGAGVDAVIVADPRTDTANPNAIRASLGTIFALPVATATVAETIAWLGTHGVAIVAARVDATLTYTDVDLTGPVAIVLGSEAEGLSDAWAGAGVVGVRLPMLGVADSLNVSAAAAVLFYEARRQRTAHGSL